MTEESFYHWMIYLDHHIDIDSLVFWVVEKFREERERTK